MGTEIVLFIYCNDDFYYAAVQSYATREDDSRRMQGRAIVAFADPEGVSC